MNKNKRLNRLLNLWLPVFNEQQGIEGDADLCLTYGQALGSSHFLNWCDTWADTGSRGELAHLLRSSKQ